MTMKVVKEKESEAVCPYCSHLNILADEADVCDHMYEAIVEEEYIHFYFWKEDSDAEAD